ncbi:hypothetical protein Taro_045217 [Colocasia esculenta]|uniref:Aminotransferase-like plant mobile domain-containing protein n=1 Tax=Colocasia esculenta TaxID=4460 RepID=A0A843X6A4_COLES|nr:hypothetical protein [Colocasia esculenta]
MGQIDIFYARWWFQHSNIFWLSPQKLREAEESRLKKKSLMPIFIDDDFLHRHFSSLTNSYIKFYNSTVAKDARPTTDKYYYEGVMLHLEPMELFSEKAPIDDDDSSDYCWWSHFLFDCGYAPDVPLSVMLPPECIGNQAWAPISAPEVVGDKKVIGDKSGDTHLDVPSSSRRRRAGKSRMVDPTPSGDSSASYGEIDEDAANLVAPDNYNPLSGDSPPLHNREYGSSSQEAEVFLPEAEDDRSPPHNPFFGIAVMEGHNTTFTFAESGLSTKQYPSASVEAYVSMPVGGYPAVGIAPEGGSDFSD